MKLTPVEISDLDRLEKVVEKGKQTFVDVGLALMEIKERKLYRRDFETWEAYCQNRWGWTRQRSQQLTDATNIVVSLPKKMSTIVDNEAKARALVPVPQAKRPAVIQAAAEAAKAENRPVTARDIQKAAVPVPKKPAPAPVPKKSDPPKKKKLAQEFQDPSVLRCDTGMVIPEALLPLWNRRGEIAELVTHLRSVVKLAKEAQDSEDPLWRKMPQEIFSNCNLALTFLKGFCLHAVCPTCLGKQPAKCGNCDGIGIVRKFYWDSCVPQEQKDMREKFIKSQS